MGHFCRSSSECARPASIWTPPQSRGLWWATSWLQSSWPWLSTKSLRRSRAGCPELLTSRACWPVISSTSPSENAAMESTAALAWARPAASEKGVLVVPRCATKSRPRPAARAWPGLRLLGLLLLLPPWLGARSGGPLGSATCRDSGCTPSAEGGPCADRRPAGEEEGEALLPPRPAPLLALHRPPGAGGTSGGSSRSPALPAGRPFLR